MVIGGRTRTLGTIGELASAVGRRPGTVRGWERRNLIPPAPVIIQPGNECTRRRLYPVELIAALQELAVTEGFGRRRPSGVFLRHQEQMWSTWRAVMALLIAEGPGITDEVDRHLALDVRGQPQGLHPKLDDSYFTE
jgi:hypothetical protein